MYLLKVVSARSSSQLRHGLNKGRTLDVPNRASKLNDADVRLFIGIVHRYLRDSLDPVLYGVCDVWDDLHSPPKIIALSFSLYNMLVYLARSDVVVSCQGYIKVSLIVPQLQTRLEWQQAQQCPRKAYIQIDLPAIIKNKDLTMLLRVHGTSIDIEVRVNLNRGNVVGVSMTLQMIAKRVEMNGNISSIQSS